MKSTGIIRKVDDLGRIVLPIELRRTGAEGRKERLMHSADIHKTVNGAYRYRYAPFLID